ELQKSIDKFVTSLTQNDVGPSSRRTIILFPGGMGSRLRRGNIADNGLGAPPAEDFDTAWLTPETFLSVDNLQMMGDVDYENKYVIARGAIELCGLSPYEKFGHWCEANQFDLYIFGYDWRRRPEHSVRFFLDVFLPEVSARVSTKG